MKIETIAVHAGEWADRHAGGLTDPIQLSTTFERGEDGGYPHGYIYSRNGNPNRTALEECLAALEGGRAAASFASGMAAATAIFQALSPGDHVVAPSDAYYGTGRLLRDLFERWGLRSTFVDMADPAACTGACEQALAEFGPIDILINNVGGRREPTPVEAQSFEDWQRLLGFNVSSTFICTKLLGGAMVAAGKGGRVINVASISAWKVLRGMGGRHYETGKGAVAQFTRAVAADWAAHGVTVNAICPGIFMTEPNQRWAKSAPERINSYLAQVPMGRFGRPEEIGPLAVFLARDASSFVTGSMYVIDGGLDLW